MPSVVAFLQFLRYSTKRLGSIWHGVNWPYHTPTDAHTHETCNNGITKLSVNLPFCERSCCECLLANYFSHYHALLALIAVHEITWQPEVLTPELSLLRYDVIMNCTVYADRGEHYTITHVGLRSQVCNLQTLREYIIITLRTAQCTGRNKKSETTYTMNTEYCDSTHQLVMLTLPW